MRETKNIRKSAPTPPVDESDDSTLNQRNQSQRELFGKDRLKPLRTTAPPPKHRRLVKKPAAIAERDAVKTTRSLPKAKADCS